MAAFRGNEEDAMKMVVLSVVCFLAVPAWATSGAVDANGCHNSKKIGWHCHPERAGKSRAEPELPYAHETARQRERRLARECANLPNAGACSGYGYR